MRHPERVATYLEHINEAIDRASEYLHDLDRVAAFEQHRQSQDAVIRNIEIIGEAANRIQRIALEFMAQHPEIPWADMRAMRNKVIHDYFEVDLEIVWNTVKNHLPQLKQQITHLLREQQRQHEFEQEREQDRSR